MKQTVLRYGTYSSIFLIVFFVITWLIWGNAVEKDFKIQEVLGYLAIFLATLFAFFGIKHYRDNQNNGMLTFGQGLKIGLFIVLLGAFTFAVVDTIYIVFLDPNFYETYYQVQLNQIKGTVGPSEYEEIKKEMQEQKVVMSNPVITFLIIFFTVVLIGFIVSVVSALMLKRTS